MNDEAVVTIKADTQIGLIIINGPEDVESIDDPDAVLAPGRLLALMLAMVERRDQGHYIPCAELDGRWRPIDRIADGRDGAPDDLLWRLALPVWGLCPEDGEQVVVKLNPTPEYLLDVARRRTIFGTIGMCTDRPGSAEWDREKLIKRLGIVLGVRLWDIEWVEPAPGRKEPRLRFTCDRSATHIPLRSVRGQTLTFRGRIGGNSTAIPRRLRRGDWDLVLAVMGVIVGRDVLGDDGWARVRARAAQAPAPTPAV